MIELYWKNASDRVVPPQHGVTAEDLDRLDEPMRRAHAAVCEQARSGRLGYAALPAHREYPAAVKAMVQRYRDNTTDLVVLGIGGSALGNIALQTALNPVDLQPALATASAAGRGCSCWTTSTRRWWATRWPCWAGGSRRRWST